MIDLDSLKKLVRENGYLYTKDVTNAGIRREYLKKYLEVNEANRLPFKVLSRKQMIVAGLRLLLRLTGGGDGHE